MALAATALPGPGGSWGTFSRISTWRGPESVQALHDSHRSGRTSVSFRTPREDGPFLRPALTKWIDPQRLGAALLITCSCDDVEECPASERNNPLYENEQLLVPGGKYRANRQAMYRQQVLLGAEIVADALESMGVPMARVFHNDFTTGDSSEPKRTVLSLISSLPQHCPDILVYYCGPSMLGGPWALGWRDFVDDEERHATAVLQPEDLLPEPGPAGGPVGLRFIVADAPDTARMWMRPSTRLVGLAAWEGPARSGGPGGPPLARWLAGYTPRPPEGVSTFDLPPDVGLRILPAYQPLFWGKAYLDAGTASSLLWELQEFVGAPTQFHVQQKACSELLSRGGSQLLLLLLFIHAKASEALLLQIIWLLHHLVLHAPVERWVGTMEEAFTDVLSIHAARSSCSPELLAAVLGFLAATSSRCAACGDLCANGSWPQVHSLVLLALDEIKTHTAVASGAKVVAQVASCQALDMMDHRALLDGLVAALLCSYSSSSTTDEAREAAAEALLFVSMRGNEVKKYLLAKLTRSGQLPSILESSGSGTVSMVLAVLRSLAAVEPSSEVVQFVESELVDSVIHCLCVHAMDTSVQRWGLATLGALAAADEGFAERCAEPGITCIVWALGASAMAGQGAVEQEALFCAHALCHTATGRAQVSSEDSKITGLAAAAIARSSNGGQAEGSVWGLRFFERLARSKATLPSVEPYIGVVVSALCAPGCRVNAAKAATEVLVLLADNSPLAHDRIFQSSPKIVKALTQLARRAAEGGHEEGRRQEKDLWDWAKVFMATLGEPEDRSYEEAMEDYAPSFEGTESSAFSYESETGRK